MALEKPNLIVLNIRYSPREETPFSCKTLGDGCRAEGFESFYWILSNRLDLTERYFLSNSINELHEVERSSISKLIISHNSQVGSVCLVDSH